MWRAGKRILSQSFRLIGYRGRTGARSLCLNAEEKTPSVLDAAAQLKPGDTLHGYTVNKVVPVPELFLVSVQLTHNKTGAQHLHIARDDANNVFSVGFRTTPMDSTGVSHILEHTALCGSEKFPCRDPFFKMLNRSLATFMNAFTASDFTMYPFSTQNAKDFKNLLSVYLDAVFFPRLRELDFLQEGWRLESEDLSDPASALTFKGVVFNEMKGAMSTAESLFVRHAQRQLLPSHTYSHNSGGDPLDIPDLTWKALKDFHASHYHPSNARFYTYGDLPLESHLMHIEEVALRHFSKIETETDIPHEPRWTQPREAHISCPSDPIAADPDKQTTVSLHYLLGSTADSFEAFTLSILSTLLISGPNSPFYQALIESNLGHDYSPGVGYDNGTKDASFSIGLQGIRKDDVPSVVETIHSTFDKVLKEGFPPERIEGLLHTVELATKHQTSNFGLGLISNIMHSWNHGADPIDLLLINQHVKKFKECLEEPNFLQNKIQQYFMSNPHCLTFTMSPDPDYEKEQVEKEKEKLAQNVSLLSEQDKRDIHKRNLQLVEEQNAVQDVTCLPKMLVTDIDPEIKPVHLEHYVIAGVPMQFSEQPTNGITYFRALSSISDIPDELKPYLPLFCFVLTRMGAGNLDYREMAQLTEMKTGGLSVTPHVSTHHTNKNAFEQGLMFSSHCLDRNLPHMFYLWGEIFSRPTLDNTDRLRTLINMLAADLAMSIAHSGHVYASSMATSSLTPAGQLSELLGGLTQVLFMKSIAETDDLSPVIEKLSTIAVHVLEGTQFRCAVNSTADSRHIVDNALEGFCDSLASSLSDQSSHVQIDDFQPRDVRTHFEVPFPVNYVSRCLPSVPYTHEDFPRLRILAKLLSSKFLHREIREKGGAYGSGARVGGGVFSFQSYRDPNFKETLAAFEKSIEWAASGGFTDDDINEAKLGVFASVDSPVSPANRGLLYFSQGITDEMRQTQRQRLFSVDREDLVRVACRYLASSDNSNACALLGPQNDLTTNDTTWTIRKENLG